ncbi:SGNH/GDSL hydrolase family protein [Nonomuraea sp. NPDC049400]|uniref:SGNH/GDSL hydrolase family protein n=1 Tax=Nonomuraea sp. NPDC049400 TaxID=3364352 RepID=UPI0037A653C7
MSSRPRRLATIALAVLISLAGFSTAHASPRAWSASWTASPQRPSASFAPNWSEQGFADQTIRQVVRVGAGGELTRVRLSNAYGSTPLKVAGATVARTADGAAIRRESLRHLTVKGARAFTVAPGRELATDPVPLRLASLESVTITLYLAGSTGPATFHAQALATTYRAAGDHRSDAGGAAFTQTSSSWYYLSGVDVAGGPARRDGVVAFGDSITDGAGSSADANNRYPDQLAERLAAAGRRQAVLNQGIAGNRLTVDSAWFGDRAVDRFRRDVLGQPSVGTVIILMGTNDIGISELAGASPYPIFAPYPDVSAAQVIAGHRELIRAARANGLRVIGATLTPVKGSAYYTPRSEAKRDAINAWIRTSGAYDAVVDLDRALAFPDDPDRLAPPYDSGDHLHPSDAGYQAMAAAVDPNTFR